MSKTPSSSGTAQPVRSTRLRRIAVWGDAVAAAGALVLLIAAGIAAVLIYPKLPNISELSDYRPKLLPLRFVLGRRQPDRRHPAKSAGNLTLFADIPTVMKDAVLAVEDARFYDHGGVDYKGFLRAAVASLKGGRKQGASTITMQVARNVYLSSERTLSRKTYEILLAMQLESELTKDQILEIYLNQIYLGNRAYGFAAAAQTYFGKPLKDVTIAEAAMLAGLPKAPGTNNPLSNPRRARARQLYVIDRMQETGFITAEQATGAKAEELHLRDAADPNRLHAEHAAEMVRQMMHAQYGDSIYTSGLNVYTSLVAADQAAAYRSLRRGIMDYERRQAYRGPEAFADLPDDPKDLDDAVDDALSDHPDKGDVIAALVPPACAKAEIAVRANAETVQVTGEGLRPAQSGLSDKAPAAIKIRRGAVIRVAKTAKGTWEITQLPEVEGAFVALDPRSGAIKAMVGGFDYGKSKFNHVTQAWRQPGSSFKPFIYSAALEKGFAPSTVVNDAPLYFEAGPGRQAWEPKNFEGTYEGPITLRRALQESKNLVTLRVLQSIGVDYAQDWITRFGFDRDRHPANLPMGLGAGSVTPMQMAAAYSVFANGGYRVSPYLVTRVTDLRGKVLLETEPPVLDEDKRAIPERNAFIMGSLLQSVVNGGTATKARQALKRNDLFGKTGTTNDSFDTWFAGFQPTMVPGIAWVGYDTPRQLGVRGETGGSLSLPIWVGFMQSALQGVPVSERRAPAGVVNVEGRVVAAGATTRRAVALRAWASTPSRRLRRPRRRNWPACR